MIETELIPCPSCGARLIVVGDQRMCLDCAYQEDQSSPPPLLHDSAESALSDPQITDAAEPTSSSESPAAPASAEPSAALWLPPRRNRGAMTTPLGFQAGHACPRVCGGVLEESAGVLRCTGCDFRYPDSPELPGLQETSPPPQRAVISPPGESSPAPIAPAASEREQALAEERDILRREVARLREENLHLVKLVTDLLQDLPRPDEADLAPAKTASAETDPPLTAEAASAVSESTPPARSEPLPGEGKAPLWWRSRSDR